MKVIPGVIVIPLTLDVNHLKLKVAVEPDPIVPEYVIFFNKEIYEVEVAAELIPYASNSLFPTKTDASIFSTLLLL